MAASISNLSPLPSSTASALSQTLFNRLPQGLHARRAFLSIERVKLRPITNLSCDQVFPAPRDRSSNCDKESFSVSHTVASYHQRFSECGRPLMQNRFGLRSYVFQRCSRPPYMLKASIPSICLAS